MNPSPTAGGPLSGFTIVVTRATDQAGTLVDALNGRGASVVELPVVAVADPTDGGAALATALDRLVEQGSGKDWLVVTSPNGAQRVADRLAGRRWPGRIATVGPKTSEPLVDAGHSVDLVPGRAVAEGLLEEFPVPPTDGGRVVLVRAEVARDVLPDGLRAAGWDVDVVVAYRNVVPKVDAGVLAAACGADLVTFTSESTVRRFYDLVDGVGPPAAACIGPISGAAARDLGYEVVEADPHSVDGLVAAVERWAVDAS